jgi:nitrate/nitrite transport system permease protein
LGTIPGPVAVWHEADGLLEEHYAEKQKMTEFYQRQEERNKAKLAEDPKAEIKLRPYTGKSTYLDQILTSLKTVFAGFLIASLIAVPLGILCGMSPVFNTAINPLIQIFKPVSPLAWLPIVTLVVSAVYVTDENSWFAKSFITSAVTVTLCSLWPTLINTAVGVASIDRDLVNVGKVLRLDWSTQIKRIILPSALPYIFTGMRLSLGVGWMVLIAAEMLAQNPGLGKFVWDEFQNGSSNSLSRIMVAVFTIGIIGFILDRVMQSLQTVFSFSKI